MGLGKTVMLISLILKTKENEIKKEVKVRSHNEFNDDGSDCSIATVEKAGLGFKSEENEELTVEMDETGRELSSKNSTTLVVAPLSLVSQWEEEIASKCNLSCFVFYGDRKLKNSVDQSMFDQYDVVITSCEYIA